MKEAEDNGLVEEIKRLDFDCCLSPAGCKYKSPRWDPVIKKWVTAARMYIDYRKINKYCQNSRYDLPCPDDLFTYLHSATYYIAIYLKGYFPSLKMDEESARTFAFSCNGKRYKTLYAMEGIKTLPIIAVNILEKRALYYANYYNDKEKLTNKEYSQGENICIPSKNTTVYMERKPYMGNRFTSSAMMDWTFYN